MPLKPSSTPPFRLRDLQVLVAVGETGNMGKAAKQLGTSQPAISRAIADLEYAAGARLLDRSRRGVTLTVFGKALVECGLSVFDALRTGKEEIDALLDPEAGEVRVGSTRPIASSFVTAVVQQVGERYPRVTFDVRASDSETLYNDLAERRVDLLIARQFPQVTTRGFEFEPLYQDPYVVIAATHSQWAKRRNISLAEMASEPWTLPREDVLVGATATAAFRKTGEQPRTVVRTDSHEVRLALVASGRYLSIVPSSLVRFHNRGSALRRLPVELNIADMPIGIVTLKDRNRSPAAELFISCARRVAKVASARAGR